MISLSKKADYGLLFLSVLAKEGVGSFVSVKSVSDENNIPYAFLTKIATELKDAGVVKSREGSGGGYSLSDLAENIYLHDVVVELDGPVAPVSCMKGNECSCNDSCGHKDVMEKLGNAVEDTLKDYSLADLIKNS